jgi:hypothetical protein
VKPLFSTLYDSLRDEGDPPLYKLPEIMSAALPTPEEIS